ncbi:lanthionine synthetase C family protein [Streptomyces sp. BH055]|uniref:lanthionine synthetase C family protein n=1 Tax=unclassified Streptomyces TaxID=2593676 RepID=UPI003BB7CA4C
MITSPLSSPLLEIVDQVAHSLADPEKLWPHGRPDGGRAWPQSLAGGESGIALLHIERARTDRGDWATAHTWITAAIQGDISAAANANLFFGAPALAFVVYSAASASSRYLRLLDRLDSATCAVTETRLAAAHERLARRTRPLMEEFDLIQGLSGLGAYHLARHPHHRITRDVLTYLVRLTNPRATRGELPPWWMDCAPTGALHPDYPGGHGNFGVAHGIHAVLSVLARALRQGLTVPGLPDAVRRICAWTDQWRQGDESAPWWPGQLTVQQVAEQHVDAALRPRPSWCYGIAGTARAQQLAGLALDDRARVEIAENAMLAVLRDPQRLDQLPEIGLCHGMAGLLHSAWRMATETGNTRISAYLPPLAERLATALRAGFHDPELLDGATGAALALHTYSTGITPRPHWDTFLALA